MKVLDIQCSQGHVFEGWFGSEQDFVAQCERSLVGCPMCGDVSVSKKLSAPRLNLSGAKAPVDGDGHSEASNASHASAGAVPAVAERPELLQALHRVWVQVAQHVVANTDDVGDRFAEEARRIHYGETEVRAIRGQTTSDEARELIEEGIDLLALPIPEHLKKPLQ